MLQQVESCETRGATALAGARRQDGVGLGVVGPTSGSARMTRRCHAPNAGQSGAP